ncbi:MAG: DNA polymerase III subunit gamma/tau [Kiritimatiellae bacterium]|nr:DNA polymerase III subunit gamma/tau [Kiritimatiellia bacterium]
MAYEVLARKWRPQQFDDVVGQEHVTRTLKNAIESKRVAHAYLFVGPRGIGKTSTARILAKALNCLTGGPTVQPCDKCDACREIMAGTNLDVLEIDGASNNGVEQVRDLRQNAQYAPARGPFKIYIIDEVHMLSIAAFNALLKTLEEPPPHVKFVFATTEPQKVPATILSRCQRFDLRPIMTREIVQRLELIAKDEKLDIDQDALLAIARGAEGGLRDAESALDQLISFRGRKIREEDVMAVFGLVARKSLEELAGAILHSDIPAAMRLVADLHGGGKDMQRVVIELLEYFRNILVFLHVGGKPEYLDMTEAQIETVSRQAADTRPGRVLRIIEVLTDADQRLRYALSKRTLLEVALIRCARAAAAVSLDEILEQVNRLKSSLGAGGGETGRDDPDAPRAAEPSARAPERPAVVCEDRPSPAAPKSAPRDGEDEAEMLAQRWHEIVDRVGRAAPLAKGYLMDAKPVEVTRDLVKIGFDPEFSGDKEKIDFPHNRKVLQKVFSEVLRRDVSVEFSVLSTKDTLPGDIKLKETKAGIAPEGHPLQGTRKMSIKAKQDWMQNPVVQKTLEMFNGDIVDIRE